MLNSMNQGRLMPMPIPRAEHGTATLDHQALRQGVEGLPGEFSRYVRRRQDMPAQVRPQLDGLPLVKQIAAVLDAHQVYRGGERGALADESVSLRCIRVTRIYDDLARLGIKLVNVDALRERHARQLLAHWRERGLAVATIRTHWSTLRTWTLALGKGGLVAPLETYWPDAPKVHAPKPGSHKDPGRMGRRHDDPQVLARLLRHADLTHFYIERLGRDLGLTVEESLMFTPAMAADYLRDKLVLQPAATQQPKAISLGGHDQVLLVQEVQDFLARSGRNHLMWRDISLRQGVRKHENHMAYQRRQVRKALGAADHAGANGCGESAPTESAQGSAV